MTAAERILREMNICRIETLEGLVEQLRFDLALARSEVVDSTYEQDMVAMIRDTKDEIAELRDELDYLAA